MVETTADSTNFSCQCLYIYHCVKALKDYTKLTEGETVLVFLLDLSSLNLINNNNFMKSTHLFTH